MFEKSTYWLEFKKCTKLTEKTFQPKFTMIRHKMFSGQDEASQHFLLCLRFPVHHLWSFVLCSSQTYLKFVEQLLQRHLLFRNTLQERLSAEHWKSLVGDILVQLIGQNDVSCCPFWGNF